MRKTSFLMDITQDDVPMAWMWGREGHFPFYFLFYIGCYLSVTWLFFAF